jgi:hypothetical protein
LLGAGLIFGGPKGISQLPTTSTITQSSQQLAKDSIPNSLVAKPNTGDGNYIQGTVTDARNGEAIGFAVIFIKGTNVFTEADDDGKFKIAVPDRLINNTCTIVTDWVGYKSQEMIINSKHFPQFLAVAMESGDFMGDVKIIVHKSSLYQRFLNLFRSKKNRR